MGTFGPRKMRKLSCGKRVNRKDKMLGQIIESVDNNLYSIAFSDGVTRKLSSRSLKKATEEESTSYFQLLNQIVTKPVSSTATQDIIPNDPTDDYDPFRHATLLPNGKLNQPIGYSDHSFDKFDDDDDTNNVSTLSSGHQILLDPSANNLHNTNALANTATPSTQSAPNHLPVTGIKNLPRKIEDVYKQELDNATKKVNELAE